MEVTKIVSTNDEWVDFIIDEFGEGTFRFKILCEGYEITFRPYSTPVTKLRSWDKIWGGHDTNRGYALESIVNKNSQRDTDAAAYGDGRGFTFDDLPKTASPTEEDDMDGFLIDLIQYYIGRIDDFAIDRINWRNGQKKYFDFMMAEQVSSSEG